MTSTVFDQPLLNFHQQRREVRRLALISIFIGLFISPVLAAGNTFTVVVDAQGNTQIDSQPITGALSLNANSETILVQIYQYAAQTVPVVTVNLTLPVTMPAEWQPRLIPSKCVCQTTTQRLDATHYQLTATGIIVGSELTLSADFPIGTFSLDASQSAALSAERASPWLITLAALLLLGALGVLIWLAGELAALRKFRLSPSMVTAPPSSTEPAVLSTLPSGKITQATLAAMLVSLAQRGFIEIIELKDTFEIREKIKVDLTGPGFALGSLPGDIIPPGEIEKAHHEGVSLAEKYLLAKLFTQQQPLVTRKDLQARFGRRISSWKIGKVYAELYKQLAKDGFFIRNPHDVHLKYRGLGIAIFFIGLVGFGLSFLLPGNSLYLILMWAMVSVCGYVITRMVPYLPLLTVMGQAEWARWAGFRLYLGAHENLPPRAAKQFFDYFGYAIAFGELGNWSRRFAGQTVPLPTWYITDRRQQRAGEVDQGLGKFLEYIAHALATMHEHTVR